MLKDLLGPVTRVKKKKKKKVPLYLKAQTPVTGDSWTDV